MHPPVLINELLVLLQAFAELPARFRQPPHPVKDFLFHYRYVFYISWGIFCIIRTSMNMEIYQLQDNEDVQFSARIFRNRGISMADIINFFTFWWLDYKTEEDLVLRKKMQTSNVVNVCFIIYTVLIFAIWIYNYGYQSTAN